MKKNSNRQGRSGWKNKRELQIGDPNRYEFRYPFEPFKIYWKF